MKQISIIAGLLLIGLSNSAKAECWFEPDGSYCCGDMQGRFTCRKPSCHGHSCMMNNEEAAVDNGELLNEEAKDLFDSLIGDEVTEQVVHRANMGYLIIRERKDHSGVTTTCVHNSNDSYRCDIQPVRQATKSNQFIKNMTHVSRGCTTLVCCQRTGDC